MILIQFPLEFGTMDKHPFVEGLPTCRTNTRILPQLMLFGHLQQSILIHEVSQFLLLAYKTLIWLMLVLRKPWNICVVCHWG